MDENIFMHPDEFLPGCVAYEVECSHRGMTALRRLVDRDWGRDWNGGELVQRPSDRTFDPYMLKSFGKRWVFSGKKHVILENGRLAGVFDLSFSTGMYQKKLLTLPDTRIYRAFLDRYGEEDVEGYDFSEPRIREYMGNSDWHVRRAAFVHFFGNRCVKDERNKEVVRMIPHDPSPEVRLAAVYACESGGIATGDGYAARITMYMNPLLDSLIDDRNDVVRCAAAMSCFPSADAAKKIVARGFTRATRYFADRGDLPGDALMVLAEHCDDPEMRASLMMRAMGSN